MRQIFSSRNLFLYIWTNLKISLNIYGKLQRVISKQCRLDDLDNPVYQEVLSCGQTYLLFLKDGMTTYLKSVKNSVEKRFKMNTLKFSKAHLQGLCNKAMSLSPHVVSTISTGNFVGKCFGLGSDTGYTIALKRTNVFELAAQLTAVCKFAVPHYSTIRRSYYPESWGFLCPTQTPEGENIGLHNHLASQCKITELSSERINADVLFALGVVSYDDPAVYYSDKYHPVMVDGRMNGWVHESLLEKLIFYLKALKVLGSPMVPNHTEIVFISKLQHLLPGVYIFSSSCRMVRKCLNRYFSRAELIGLFEQVFQSKTSYRETENKAHFLSLSAAMIPFFENNAAVRNIFSSVKVKQALGIPFYNYSGRSDPKHSRLVCCQTPVVSSKIYSESNFDFYPHGTNVIVAVLSYSGYDMEDALTLNKASVERGLMSNETHKTVYFDFGDLAEDCGCGLSDLEFKRNDEDIFVSQFLDEDGLPFVGAQMSENCPLLSVRKAGSENYVVKYYSERHGARISAVRLMGDVPSSGKNIPKNNKKVSITYSIKTVPEVGDKFSNGHGGKGVCGALLPTEDLPFTADGLVPDVLFNPHGLASRMSIGFLFEMATAKVHIMKGSKYIVEPFQTGKSKKTYKKVGEALTQAGFDYYGTEKFFSGTSGEELEADVFCGSAYYLRLHHMVRGKFQVRSVGPVDDKTYQPLNPGLSGAIRFGEMEKDAIVSHGAIESTLDRLLHNSDKCTAYLCTSCHQILNPVLQHPLPDLRSNEGDLRSNTFCTLCRKESTYKLQIPYVLVYLISELSVLGLRLKFLDK